MFALSPGMVRTKGRPGALALVLCAVTAAATNGCSALFVDGPPANARKLRAFNCTTSNSWPTTDVILGGLTLLDGLGAVTSASQTSSGGINNGNYVAAGVALGGAALFAASAASGYKNTSACRDATGELMTRLYPPGGAPPNGFAPYAPTAQPYAPTAQPYDPWTAPPPAAASPPGSAPPLGDLPQAGPAAPPPAAVPLSLPETWDSSPPAPKRPAAGQSAEPTPPAPPAPGGGAAK
ncbi:MAG TPA: hypothetical protein VGK52_01055 [Polyangia bacterium]